jgi:hypothetical protein
MVQAPARKKCFVLMPFTAALREVYDNVYRVVCSELNIDCWRVDEISRPGSITRDIIEGILDADIVIADLTGRNSNVFYELGIAHVVGNKTIMTAQSVTDVPFDIGNYRVILYEQSIGGAKPLAEKLRAAIGELLQALDRTNNPFSRGGHEPSDGWPAHKDPARSGVQHRCFDEIDSNISDRTRHPDNRGPVTTESRGDGGHTRYRSRRNGHAASWAGPERRVSSAGGAAGVHP